MVIEASVVAGYVIAWVVARVRRIGSRLNAEADTAVDAGLDKLHQLVADKLGPHPALADAEEEAGAAEGTVSELTRQQIELAITGAARKDDAFADAVTAALADLRAAEHSTGRFVIAGGEARVFTGDGNANASTGGIAFGQVAGDVHLGPPHPSQPGRSAP